MFDTARYNLYALHNKIPDMNESRARSFLLDITQQILQNTTKPNYKKSAYRLQSDVLSRKYNLNQISKGFN